MSMDDDDEVALDGGMEPEAPNGTLAGDESDMDEGDGDGDGALETMTVSRGGGASRVETPKGTRPVSAKVRQMIADIAKQTKAAPDDGDEDVAIGGEEMEPAHGKGKAAPALLAGSTQAGAAGSQQATTAAPPAPSLDPEVTKLRETYTARMAELDAREQALADQAAASDFGALAEEYTEKGGAGVVVKLLKKFSGLDGDALKEEVADLVTALSMSELGVDVPPEVRDRLDRKITSRALKAMKEGLSKREQDAAKQREQAQETEKRNYAVHLLREELKKPDHSTAYPHLAAEDDPGTLIVELYERRIKEGRDPKAYQWSHAAKEVNDYLEKQGRAWFDKRAHLFTAAPGGQGNGAAKQTPTRETTQGQRRSPAKPEQPAPTPVQIVKNGRYDPEAHRRQTKQKIRGLFKASAEE